MKTVKLSAESISDVVIGRGALSRADDLFDLKRRVLVLTDREVPKEYADAVCEKSLYPVRISVWPGESVNSIENYQRICDAMAENSFGEGDCVVSVGGERILSLGAFVAATYKCGIDHYCVPTTFASQIGNGFFGNKSVSIGKRGSVAGTSKLPRRVLVDADLLSTLDPTQITDGYADVIRLGLVLDKKLFEYLEKADVLNDDSVDYVLTRAIEIKNYVYRKQKEAPGGVKALSFGNMIADNMEKTQYSYGERLAIAMIPMCSGDVRIRLRALFTKLGLPAVWQYDVERIYRDSLKGNESDKISVIMCKEIGSHKTDKLTVPEYYKLIKTAYGG